MYGRNTDIEDTLSGSLICARVLALLNIDPTLQETTIYDIRGIQH